MTALNCFLLIHLVFFKGLSAQPGHTRLPAGVNPPFQNSLHPEWLSRNSLLKPWRAADNASSPRAILLGTAWAGRSEGWPLCWWVLGSYLVYSSLKTSDGPACFGGGTYQGGAGFLGSSHWHVVSMCLRPWHGPKTLGIRISRVRSMLKMIILWPQPKPEESALLGVGQKTLL